MRPQPPGLEKVEISLIDPPADRLLGKGGKREYFCGDPTKIQSNLVSESQCLAQVLEGSQISKACSTDEVERYFRERKKSTHPFANSVQENWGSLIGLENREKIWELCWILYRIPVCKEIQKIGKK